MLTKPDIKTYLQVKRNPNLFILEQLNNTQETTKQIIGFEISKAIEDIKAKYESSLEKINKEFLDEIKNIEILLPKLEKRADEIIKAHITSKVVEIKGEKGDSYVLTDSDKKDIASKVKVPTVKETIIEKPTITQVVKEVAISDKPEEIAVKLNTLTGKVEKKVIKDLEKDLDQIRKSIISYRKGSGKGGGMGNVQHEVKNVSSATTTVTTDYPIAGNGYAIFSAWYQGQGVDRGVHYTVGADNRTLTLTFTPSDDTFFSLIYIRG